MQEIKATTPNASITYRIAGEWEIVPAAIPLFVVEMADMAP